MDLWYTEGSGRARAGDKDRLVASYGVDRGQRWPIVWHHGAGGDYRYGPLEDAVARILGSPWACTDQAGAATWGSDAAQAASIGDAAWAVTALGAKNGKAILHGGSMGGLTAILTAINNPTKVAAVSVCIPAIDPEYARANNVNGTAQAQIEAVYGVGTVPTVRQAYQRGTAFAATGIPLKLWYSTTDIFTPLASTQQFIADSGCQSTSLGAVGHSYISADYLEIAAFIAPYI